MDIFQRGAPWKFIKSGFLHYNIIPFGILFVVLFWTLFSIHKILNQRYIDQQNTNL